jgi:hypothetical protein
MKEVVCQTRDEIINSQGKVVNNPDGTISVFTINPTTQQLAPKQLNKACCDSLGIPGAYFDKNTQKCRWSASNSGPCNYDLPFNVVLNPKGNDGAIFGVAPEETCNLSVDFDYLFKFDCATLTDLVNGAVFSSCNSVIDVFESVAASMSIGLVQVTGNSTTLVNVYEEKFFNKIGTGNLYDYLSTANTLSGFFICGQLTSNSADTSCYPVDLYSLDYTGDTINCSIPINQLVQGLYNESGLPPSATTQFKAAISGNTFGPNWLHFHTDITDESVLSAITNEKIKLTLKVSGTCVDVCILVDNIRLTKNCSKVTRNDIFLTKSPGFELDRIRDNKKSWVANDTTERRQFSISNFDDTKPIRITDYTLENENQVINSKEIDLDISIAAAIETDVWDYIVDNPCILTGLTVGTSTCVKEAGYFYPGIFLTGITSTTITSFGQCSGFTATSYSCPVGYSATPSNDACQQINTTTPTFNGSGSTVLAGNHNGDYAQYGSFFYPDVLSNNALPLYYVGSGSDLRDQVGTTITANDIVTTGTFWASQSNPSFGRLNDVGLSASSTSYVGFTYCLNISVGKTYYVGIGADNYCRFFVNGVMIADFSAAVQDNFKKWSVFPLPLTSGKNIIEMYGLNDSGSDTAFGAEIYDPIDYATLLAASDTGSTGSNTIFTTKSFVGGNFTAGGNVGYSCPPGYSLDGCGTAYTCSQILTTDITVDSSVSYSGSCSIITGATPPDTVVYTSQTANVTSYTAVTTVTGVSITATLETIICEPKVYCCSDDCGDKPIDLNNLLTQPLSAITTVEDFEYFISSELIDAKNRNTISAYPTLRLLYDRYMNSRDYCAQASSAFDYFSMNQFANLIGNYWVDLVEQVIPATTLWGSTRIYSNTVFDKQKYQYKAYTSFFGDNAHEGMKVLSPATGVTCLNTVEVETSVVLGNLSGSTEFFNLGGNQKFNDVYVIQMNSGGEFLGNVTVLGGNGLPIGNNGTGIVVNEII